MFQLCHGLVVPCTTVNKEMGEKLTLNEGTFKDKDTGKQDPQ